MKLVKKLFLYSFIALILGVALLFVMKKFLINEVRISQTNTNLIEVIDKNLLKTYQMSIDVFVNYNGKYVGIIPYLVQAGFDLNKVEVKKLPDGSFLVKLPAPEIMNIDQGEGSWAKNSYDTSFLKQFMEYGELQAKYVALERGILERANEHAKEFLPELFASLGVKVRVETTKPKQIKYVTISSRRCGVDLKIPEEIAKNFKFMNWDNEFIDACVYVKSKDGRITGYLYPSPLGFGILDREETRELRQFSVLNPELEYSMGVYEAIRRPERLFMRVYYQIGGKNLFFEWMPQGTSDLKEKFPFIVLISTTLNDNHYTISEPHDCFGITKSQWEQASINDKRRLISLYFSLLPKYYRFDHQQMLLTTEENYKNMPKEVIDTLEEIGNPESEISKRLLLLIYERPSKFVFFHHESLWVFTDDRVFYAEDINSDSIIEFSLADFSKGYWKGGKFCLKVREAEEKEEVCFSKDMSPIVYRLVKYGFLKFYRK